MAGKVCTGCRELLPLTSFRAESRGRRGLRSRCIACQAAYGAAWFQRNKERLKERQRRRARAVRAPGRPYIYRSSR